MIRLSLILNLLFFCIATSCIKKEAPNSEADITKVIVKEGILTADPIIQSQTIMLMVNDGVDLTAQGPEFELTPGATISPSSGTVRDFSTPQEYIVVSQDNNWSKNYIVSFVNSKLNTKYNFEDTVKRNSKYYVFAERDNNNKIIMEWGSGNSGFAITGVAKSPLDYPTFQSPEGRTGKCLKLVTRSTGSFGESVGMPMAAGNLFIGTFDVLNALSNPLKATKFGLPFHYNPTYIQGYYKYTPGKIYKENGKEIPDKTDTFNIYAMFFETDKDVTYLDGTNQLSHPNLVATAQIKNKEESTIWRKFEIPFVYTKKVDPQKLADGKYSISIIFTSSKEGDIFNGAEGSTLMVDDVEVLYYSPN